MTHARGERPATPILDAWRRAERQKPGSTSPILRHAAAWEQAALDAWFEGFDRYVASNLQRAREVLSELVEERAA